MSEKDDFRGRVFRETPDINQVFLRQVDRVNQYAGTPIYADCVRQLGQLLPSKWREWVEENEARYHTEEPTLFYRKNCGVRMGYRDDPLMKNEAGEWGLSSDPDFPVKRLEDGRIDWDDSNIISPILKKNPQTDYINLFATIMEAAEYADLVWQKKGTRRGG